MKKKRQRSKDFVDPNVQGVLARRLALHWLLFTIVAAVLATCLQWLSDPFQSPSEAIVGASWTYGPILMLLICLVPVFVYDSIKLSNRFAGPMIRLRKAFHILAEGGIPEPVILRRTDFWRDVAADLNCIINRLADDPTSARTSNRANHDQPWSNSLSDELPKQTAVTPGEDFD